MAIKLFYCDTKKTVGLDGGWGTVPKSNQKNNCVWLACLHWPVGETGDKLEALLQMSCITMLRNWGKSGKKGREGRTNKSIAPSCLTCNTAEKWKREALSKLFSGGGLFFLGPWLWFQSSIRLQHIEEKNGEIIMGCNNVFNMHVTSNVLFIRWQKIIQYITLYDIVY